MSESTTRRITLRQLSDPEQMRVCVGLQNAVGGFSDLEGVPHRMFVVAFSDSGNKVQVFPRIDLHFDSLISLTQLLLYFFHGGKGETSNASRWAIERIVASDLPWRVQLLVGDAVHPGTGILL